MGKTLYMECNSGISGDMSVAMLLDLGADETVLREALASLPLDGYEIEISRVVKRGIDCCDFHVILDENNHDHDMHYLYDEGDGHEHHEHLHSHEHHHEHEHSHMHHDHDHNHEHSHNHHHHQDHAEGHIHSHEHAHDHSHPHTHRHLNEINQIIDGGNLTAGANALAKKIFRIIAEAESKAHNLPMDEVGFHEVGAVDSIVDIVAFAVCFDNLAIDSVFVPKLYEGTGVVRCQHGLLPVPVPAVVNILEGAGIPLEIIPYAGEFVTPTGAAIVKAIRTGGKPESGFTILRTGMGAGKRKTVRANILRGMLLSDMNDERGDASTCENSPSRESLWKLEADIDDSTGEALGYALTLLLDAGARDAHYIPCYMKKNRPAYQLQVICDEAHRNVLEDIIFRETTTIGIRRMEIERTILNRHIESVDTPYGKVRIKVCEKAGSSSDTNRNFYPEYEDVAALSRENGIAYREMYRIAQETAMTKLK
jgi:pyridinium-3,5-bisthiocarboxylic acid mononucleotide nickel chelatase